MISAHLWKEDVNPHQFRDLINTLNDGKMNDQGKCTILLNQAINDINAKH